MGKKEEDFIERRQFKRIKKHFILTYYDLLTPNQRFSASQLKDIGLGGLQLITEKFFPPNTQLVIELKTPFVSELIHLESIVVASEEKVKGIIYISRVKFDNLTPQAEYVLTKIMEYLSKNEPNSE